MKNIFNGKRFMMLLKKEALDLRSQYLMLILIVTCIFLVAFLFFTASGNDSYMIYGRLRYVIGYMLVFGSMLFAPFLLYKRYNYKTHGINYFMLPASQVEKWFSMFLNCAIVTPVVMILAFTLIDLCLYPFYPWAEKSLWLASFDSEISSDILMILALQSLIFLGNIWFQRAKVQKTIAIIIILTIAYTVLMSILGKASGSGQIGETSVGVSVNIGNLSDILPQTWRIIIQTILFLIAPIGLWIISFRKIKEQQL